MVGIERLIDRITHLLSKHYLSSRVEIFVKTNFLKFQKKIRLSGGLVVGMTVVFFSLVVLWDIKESPGNKVFIKSYLK